MRILLLFVLCLISTKAFSQGEAMIIKDTTVSFDSATSYAYSKLEVVLPDQYSEAGVLTEFNKWKRFYEGRIALNAPHGSSMFNALNDATHYFLTNQEDYCPSQGYTGNWECIGPFNDYYSPSVTEYQGRIDAVWVHPDTMGIMLAGAQTGGLWKTTDTGHTWQNITDPTSGTAVIPGTMGAPLIAVDPLNFDTIYIAAQIDITTTLRTSGSYEKGGYSLGLAYTPDGGSTWILDPTFNSLNNLASSYGSSLDKYHVIKVAYMPGTDKLFALTNKKLLYKPNSSSNWQDITPSGLPAGYRINDFEFTNSSTGKLVFCSSTKSNVFYLGTYDLNLTTPAWSALVSLSVPTPYRQTDDHAVVDMSIDGNDIAYLNLNADTMNTSTNTSVGQRQLLIKTPINSASITIKNRNFVCPLIHGDGKDKPLEHIQVSTANSDIIYASNHDAYHNFFKSTDEGETISSIQGNTHADGRCFTLYSATTSTNGIDDILVGGSDGGIVMKRSGETSFESITGSGLAITQFFGMANTEADEDIMTAGAQDNGGFSYIKGRTNKWQRESGGDNYLTKFANNGALQAYMEGNPTSSLYHYTFNLTNNTVSTPSFASPTDFGNTSCAYCEQNTHRRELYFDMSNIAYVAYRENWKKPLSSGSWSETFTEAPRKDIRAGAFIFKEPNKDTVYISYRKHADADPSTAGEGRLFFSNDAQAITSPSQWDNITHSLVQYHRINDIVTEPGNMSRIWTAHGDIDFNMINVGPSSMLARVMYSDDYGNTWDYTNYSKGLPAVPINCIVYQEGTDDRLFCGTDVGVFVWNKDDAQWYCFNNGMPPCIVTKLEFNYCAGKLRASTYGRGVWETPLYSSSNLHVIPRPTKVVSTNTTWSSSQYLLSSVKVESGATLTISGSSTTVYMPKNGEILVKPGGKLVVNGATITNGCEDCMWNGIRAEGDPSESQISTKQAVVELVDATIEHAKIALANHSSEGIPSLTTGGIIEAINTHFLNNAKSVSIEHYTYKTAWSVLLKNYQASFLECTFEINDDFKGGTVNPFSSHVVMQDVNGPAFRGCEFYNRNTGSLYKGIGEGIRALFSGFTVKAYCDPSTSPCTSVRSKFTGFSNGIYIGKVRTDLYAYIIDRADFDSCGVGIKLDGPSVGVSSRNHFNIGTGKVVNLEITTDCHKNIGIWGEWSYKPTIEDNEFEGVTFVGQHADHENIGVLMDNSGEEILLIYKNDFHDLDYAAVARGKNSENYWQPIKGIKYECNIFEDNDYDIVVREKGTATGTNIQNVAYSQGSALRSAGNVFVNTTSDNHFVNTVSFWPYNVYYHSSGTTEPNVHPTYSGLSPIFTGNAHICNTRYPTGTTTGNRDLPLSSGDLGTAKASFTANNNDLKDKMNDYISLLDGGDTDGLVDDINNATDADTPTLKTTLLNNSPYLTKTALYTLADVDILSHTGLIEILEENPEVLRDLDFLYKLENEISNPLSSTQIDDLKTVAETPSERSDKEAEIAYYQTMVADLGNLVVSHYLLDTSGTDIDSIPVWLDSIGTLQAAYLKIAHYTGIGDYTTAGSILSNIPTDFSLTTEQSNQYSLFSNLWAIIDDVYSDDRTISELTTQEVSDIEDIYDDAEADGKQIQVEIDIIWNQDEPVMKQPCDFDTVPKEGGKHGRGNSSQSGDKNIGELSSVSRNNTIKVYPNPARDYVIFDFKLSQNVSDATLNVTSPSGRLVYNKLVQSNNQSVEWDTHSVPSGIYIYELKDGNQTLDIGKVVIAK